MPVDPDILHVEQAPPGLVRATNEIRVAIFFWVDS
jgi:hypothetical protein